MPTLFSAKAELAISVFSAFFGLPVCFDPQKGVDKEFFLLLSVMDENLSWYLDDNIHKFGKNQELEEDEVFEESNKMHGRCRLLIHI